MSYAKDIATLAATVVIVYLFFYTVVWIDHVDEQIVRLRVVRIEHCGRRGRCAGCVHAEITLREMAQTATPWFWIANWRSVSSVIAQAHAGRDER